MTHNSVYDFLMLEGLEDFREVGLRYSEQVYLVFRERALDLVESDVVLRWRLWITAHIPLVIFALVLVISVAAALASGVNSAQPNDASTTTDPDLAYEALSTILVPTSHAHPKHYHKILAHAISQISPTASFTLHAHGRVRRIAVDLNFAALWRSLALGRMEIRDGKGQVSALEELCTVGAVVVYGYAVRIAWGWAWRVEVGWKLALAWMEFCVEGWGARSEGSDFDLNSEEGAARIPNLMSCLVEDILDLDFIPIPYIGAALSAAKLQVLRSRETFDVEFTCLAETVGFTSDQYMFCSAILLPNRHVVSQSKKTALPFFASFPALMKRLSSPEISVTSVSDISLVHAEALEAHEHDMVHDKWIRGSFVARHGMDAWRETRLRLKWEAALLKTKILVRWKVTLTSSK